MAFENVAMQVVSSSNIAAIGYDDAEQIVYVRFLNNTLYEKEEGLLYSEDIY